ncbi:hypothetical protein ACN9ML_11335 [Dyadobacter endophyticus]|uniref:hypothetical protein n=1 Tax=Dyadobacter TaxID=120831 RepID=UPI003CEAE862
MKNLTTTICAIVWILLLAGSAHAQQAQLANMPADERAQWQTQRMKETLQLDSAQVAKVSSINLSYARQTDPVIAGSGSRLTKLKAFRQINAAKEKELQGVLSPQQFRQFKKQQQEMKEQFRKRKS